MAARRITVRAVLSAALVLALVGSLGAFTVACATNEDEADREAADRTGVVVTIVPLAEFVEQVGGEKVDITVMVPPGASPHTYEPRPSQMTAVANAEMYAKVGSGVDFELVWMDNIVAQNTDMLVVDCSEKITLIEIGEPPEYEHGVENQEHEANHHYRGAMDPHIWMSPVNAQAMVESICDGLIEVDPDNTAYYAANRDAYLQDLTELDQDIREGLSGVANRVFMVYHPAFGYFAEEYDLTMLSIEVEGKEPTAASLARLIDQARAHDIKVIFASPQFSTQVPQVIADEIGGRVVLVDSLAEDYIANLRAFLNELMQAME